MFKASFEKGTLVMLHLEGEEKSYQYFVPTTKRPFLAMCVGTFLGHDDRAVEFPVPTTKMNGTFKIKVTIDDKKYDTGVVVEL